MTKLKGGIAASATVGLLLVTGCENIPYYNDTLDWFSWSKYDPQVNAIVAEIPPPGELGAPATAGKQATLRDLRGGNVYADPPPGVAVSPGASPHLSATGNVGVANASSNAGTGAPLVGIRNSVPGSVTWRSPRGTP